MDEGIKVDHEKIKATSDWEAPKDVKGARSFIGFANFYRNFLKNFAKISEPLQRLTKKGTPFRWNIEQQQAFNIVKN